MSTTIDNTRTQAWGQISDLIAQNSTSAPKATNTDVADKDVFMKLMVAQLRHQNPMSPADGVEFVTQLAQFTQLEQSMGMRQDLSAIRDVLTTVPDSTTQQP